MIYLYLFGTCFHFIYVFMIIGNFVYLPSPYGAEAKGRWVWNSESVRCTVFGSYACKVLSFSLFLQYPNVMIF